MKNILFGWIFKSKYQLTVLDCIVANLEFLFIFL